MKGILFFALILLSSVTMAQVNGGPSSGTSAEELIKKGIEHHNKKEYDLAIQSYSEAIRINPKYGKAYEFRGGCYLTQKKYKEAVDDYKAAINIDPANSSLHYYLGMAHYQLRKFELAIENFNQSIKLNYPDLAGVYNWIGYTQYQKGGTDEAIASYERSIQLNPTGASEPYSNLALVFSRKYQYQKALSNLNEAIRLNPQNYLAYERRGEAYYQLAQYDLAIKDYSLLITKYGYQRYYFRRGDAYQKLGDKALAIADYNKGTSIDASPDALVKRARLYERLKEYELALTDFAEAFRIAPERTWTYTERGDFYRRTKQFRLADLDYSKSIKLEWDNYFANYGKALLNKVSGDYEASIKSFKRTLQVNSSYPEPYIGIVAPLVRTEALEDARKYIEEFNRKFSYSPLDKKGWKFYKHYLMAVGTDLPSRNYENALANLDRGIEGYKEASSSDDYIEQDFMSDILALKGSLLERLSRLDEARKAYEEALTFNPIQPEVKAALEKVRRKTTPIVVTSNDQTAPVITILQPSISRGLKVVGAGKELLVKGVATDESGIRMVSVNGTTATLNEAGNFSTTVPLAVGVNNILVLATDNRGNLAKLEFTSERPVDIVKRDDVPVVTNPDAELLKTGKYYALIIGVQDYDDPGIVDLDQPVSDATLLYQTLNKMYTFETGNITLLKNPTRNAMFESLEDLAKKVTDKDNLLIFYAGHGYWDEGRKQGYWFPSDAKRLNRSSWVTNADLKEYISSISSKHTLLITDACFAGSIFKSRGIDLSVPKAITNLYELPSRKAMTSGTLKEVPDKSVFIEFLIKRLTQNADKYLTTEKLYSSFRDAVINNSANGQVPQYGEIKEAGDEGGDFIFIKR